VKCNILIDSNQAARITDFGLTSLLRCHSISISVTAPAWGGTYPWMAPELFDGSRPSRESDMYALGMVTYEVCYIKSLGISPNVSLLQVFAHERPFSHLPYHVIPVRVHKGERPSRLTDRDILGLSEDVQALMERCWDRVPSSRPHAADTLALFETASRGWVSPTPGAIANLSLDRTTRWDPLTGELADTALESGSGTTGGSASGSRPARPSPPTSSGEEEDST